MFKQLFKSPYVKATFSMILGGTILIIINNALFDTKLGNGIDKINSVLAPIYIGAFLAFLLCPIYNKIVKYVYGKLRQKELETHVVSDFSFGIAIPAVSSSDRGAEFQRCLKIAKMVASLLSMLLVIGSIALLGYFVVPQVIDSVTNMINTMPHRLGALSTWSAQHLKRFPQIAIWFNQLANAGTNEIITWIQTHVFKESSYVDMATIISNQVIQAAKVFMNIFIGLLISVYLLNYKEKIFAIGRKIVAATCSEKKSRNIFEFTSIINETFIGFIVGRILDAIVIGCLCYISMRVLGMPLPLLISVIVGVTNVIPFFGPFLGAVPSIALLMLEDPVQALYFVILILVIQQIDGNLIGPKIVGNAIGIGSFWVLVAVLIGGGLFGFLGMALGVPVFAVIYRYIGKLTDNKLKKKDRSFDTEDYMDYDKFGIDRGELFGFTGNEDKDW